MSKKSTNAQPSWKMQRQVDVACSQFEQARVAQQAPRIEDYLTRLPEPVRRIALEELIALEVDLRRAAGILASPAHYDRRVHWARAFEWMKIDNLWA